MWQGRIVKALTLIVAVLVLLTIGSNLLVRRSFPDSSGEIRLPGLSGEVEVLRDPFGVPHIYASNESDLFFVQGYVHAQDRFWQMDYWRHIGAGRLSEMFGKDQLETDAFLRTLGWARVAREEVKRLDPNSRKILESYSAGVNAYLQNHKGGGLSLEYFFLGLMNRGYKIEKWSPEHSVTWGKVMAWDLGMNMDEEIMRSTLMSVLPSEKVENLFPQYPPDNPFIVPTSGKEQQIPEQMMPSPVAAIPALFNSIIRNAGTLWKNSASRDLGSNSWVLSGERTTTGKPFLCNDPHLSSQMPSIWYQVGLHCTADSTGCGYDVAGFSFAGVPGVVIGHNKRIAWGFTNVGPDTMDLFVEKLNPANPRQYEHNGEWIDMEVIRETIKSSNSTGKDVDVLITRHGPVISSTYSQLEKLKQAPGIDLNSGKYAVALKWTALEPTVTFPAIWKMNLAQNWTDMRNAAREFDLPSQNIIYADVEGNIGYQCPGKIPVRASGDGRYPVPGWTDANDWTGFIPFDSLPSAYNPADGFIATANNPVVSPDAGLLITHDWDYGYRAKRITEMIAARSRHSTADLQRMQADSKNPNAGLLLPYLFRINLDSVEHQNARKILEQWDHQQTASSTGAMLFEAFWRALLSETFHDNLPEDFLPGGGNRWITVVRNILPDPSNLWWDNARTEKREQRDDVLKLAFEIATGELKTTLGPDPKTWRWGRLHTVTFENQSLGRSGIDPLEKMFNRGPFETGGGSAQVNATGWDASGSYAVTFLPSMRMIVDLSNLDASLAIHTTGQSGHANHKHYSDMAQKWAAVQYNPMLFTRQAVMKASTEKLRLLPR